MVTFTNLQHFALLDVYSTKNYLSMRTYFIFCLVSVFILLMSCTSNDSSNQNDTSKTEAPSKVKTLHKEVMRVHDEAMAKMDFIYQLKKKTKGFIDSLQQDSITHAETLKSARKNIELLDIADESMMAWMRSYRQPKDKSEAEATEYLQQEQEKIEGVSKLMKDNIAAAEAFLKEQMKQ